MTAPAEMPHDIAHYVPHRGTLLLLDRLLAADDQAARAELTVREDSPFARDGAVPAWVGIEYMAQTIAAWAGARARTAGREPGIGYLLGSRRYTPHCSRFTTGQILHISARCELIGDNGLGQFDCHIRDAHGQLLAEAMVSVFEPPPEGAGTGPATPHEGAASP